MGLLYLPDKLLKQVLKRNDSGKLPLLVHRYREVPPKPLEHGKRVARLLVRPYVDWLDCDLPPIPLWVLVKRPAYALYSGYAGHPALGIEHREARIAAFHGFPVRAYDEHVRRERNHPAFRGHRVPHRPVVERKHVFYQLLFLFRDSLVLGAKLDCGAHLLLGEPLDSRGPRIYPGYGPVYCLEYDHERERNPVEPFHYR